MAVNCSLIGLDYRAGSLCLPVAVTLDWEEFTIDEAWFAGAFFLGLLLGVALTVLCVKPFLAAWEKRKRQNEAEMLLEAPVVAAESVLTKNSKRFAGAVPEEEEEGKGKRKTLRFKRRQTVQDADESSGRVKVEVDVSLCRGMVDVLTHSDGVGAAVEMGEQDMSSIVAMERSQEQEKETVLVKVLEFVLKKKAAKRLITDNFRQNFVKKTQQDLRDIRHMIDREKEEEEERLKSDTRLSRDSQTLESELQALQTRLNVKQAKLQREHLHQIRDDLLRSSGMTLDDVESVMGKLLTQMSDLEESMGREQARQRRVLEERLAKRRQVLEYRQEAEEQQEERRHQREVHFKDVVLSGVNSGQLLDRQNDEVTQQYRCGLYDLYQELNKDREHQWGNVSPSLQQSRLSHMQNLMLQQAKERASFIKKADAATSTQEIVKGYHDLLCRQHGQQEELSEQLDEQDVRKMEELAQAMEKAENRAAEEELEKVLEKLESVTDISSSQTDKLLQQHRQRMQQLQVRQQRDRQAMLQRLEERRQQRLVKAAQAEARDAEEQQTLCEEQAQTLHKVLASNIDLTEEAKEQILRQHEQNMQALSNQLQRSKMRQQKSLELKLTQRRARLVELKKQEEDARRGRREMKDKERQQLQAKLAEQISAEERKMEEARQAAVAELRRQLAAETEQALRLQDAEIGLLIARLQVGQARRKAILERQDKDLKELQDKVERQAASGEGTAGSVAEHLLQQHYHQVELLNSNLQRHRSNQERQLAEKVNLVKRKKEQQITTQLEQDAQEEYTQQQKRGAGFASLALLQSFLEQRHQRAMAELEQETRAALEKEKEEMQRAMQHQLHTELQAHRQNLLTQLAAVTKMSNQELEDAVDAAVAGKPTKRQAERLAQDLRVGMERSKSSLSNDHHSGSQQGVQLRPARSDLQSMDSTDAAATEPRPRSSQRFLKRQPAYAADDGDEDF